MTMQVIATTERLSAPQQLLVGAVYFSSEVTAETDSFRILDTARASVTGGTQQFTLKVDITKCLADVTRRGSRDACSVSIVAFLLDQGQSADTSDVFESAYDFKIVGPFDLSPGSTPVVPSIDLSTSRFAVRRWEGDEALRLGGTQTPQFYNGPITGFAAAGTTGPPTLFAVTQGQDNIIPPNGGQPTFQPVAQLVVFQNGTWRRVNGPGGGVTFYDVAALSATDVYIAASDGLYHYDGAAISAVSAVRDNLRSVAVTSAGATARFLVAGALNGSVWTSNLSTYTRLSTGTTQVIDGVCVTGPNEAFAASRAGGGGLFRFDGTAWSSVPASASQGKTDLQCGAPGQAFVTAQTGQGQLLRWTGTTWTPLPNPPAVGRTVQYAVVSPTEIYGAGDSANTNRAFYRYDGSTWREVARTQYTGGIQFRPWADPRGGAAYVASSNNGSTRIDQVNATSARPVSYHPSFRDVMMTSASNAFVVGVNNLLARFDGTRWTVDAPPATPNQQLRGVWTDGSANAWAVGHRVRGAALGRDALERGVRRQPPDRDAGRQLQRRVGRGRVGLDRRGREHSQMPRAEHLQHRGGNPVVARCTASGARRRRARSPLARTDAFFVSTATRGRRCRRRQERDWGECSASRPMTCGLWATRCSCTTTARRGSSRRRRPSGIHCRNSRTFRQTHSSGCGARARATSTWPRGTGACCAPTASSGMKRPRHPSRAGGSSGSADTRAGARSR